jgi:hypothetical protein
MMIIYEFVFCEQSYLSNIQVGRETGKERTIPPLTFEPSVGSCSSASAFQSQSLCKEQ